MRSDPALPSSGKQKGRTKAAFVLRARGVLVPAPQVDDRLAADVDGEGGADFLVVVAAAEIRGEGLAHGLEALGYSSVKV